MPAAIDLEDIARKFFADLLTAEEVDAMGDFLESEGARFPLEVRVAFPKLRLTAKLVFAEADGVKSISGKVAFWDWGQGT